MFGEKAERRRPAPISSATEWKRLLKISSIMGSTCRVIGFRALVLRSGQNNVLVCVHICMPTRQHHRRRAVIGDDCWTGELISSLQLASRVHRRGGPFPVK